MIYIIKFGHCLRFSDVNSAKKCRRSIPKGGKDASLRDLNFVRQKFSSRINMFRVIYEIAAKNQKKRKIGRGCHLWPQISRPTEFCRTSGLRQQTGNIVQFQFLKVLEKVNEVLPKNVLIFPILHNAPPPIIFMLQKMNFLAHENVEILTETLI